MNERKLFTAVGFVVMVACFAYTSAADSEDAKRQQREYCQDVAVWQAEAARGIAPMNRTGAPDYKGIAADVCPGLRPAP
tara:strand:- start:284 stop:520 length:237 start_codon:yes stop_codon:yes gene_type:complete